MIMMILIFLTSMLLVPPTIGNTDTTRITMVNYSSDNCEFSFNCASNCLRELNQNHSSRMVINDGLQPSSSWVNVTGLLAGDHHKTLINFLTFKGRILLQIYFNFQNKSVVLKNDDNRARKVANKWFVVGEEFKLHVLPEWENKSAVRFYVHYVLPNNTLDLIGRDTIKIKMEDDIDHFVAIETYGDIFITSYCYCTCTIVRSYCM